MFMKSLFEFKKQLKNIQANSPEFTADMLQQVKELQAAFEAVYPKKAGQPRRKFKEKLEKLVAMPVTAPVSPISSETSLEDLDVSAIQPAASALDESDLHALSAQAGAIATEEKNIQASPFLLLRDATPKEKLAIQQELIQKKALSAIFHGNAKNSSIFRPNTQMGPLNVNADVFKPNQEENKADSQEQASKLLSQLIRALEVLAQYEVASAQDTLSKHVLTLKALKIEGNANLQTSLNSIKVTLGKASYGTRGGVSNEQTTLSVFYADAVRAVQKALDSITKLFVGEAGIEKNVVAKALLGRSFFFQATTTNSEQAVIDEQINSVRDRVSKLTSV